METSEILEVYKALFETWRFQVNSHWQRSSFFAAFETVALAACWKLLANKADRRAVLGEILLALLGLSLTVVWYLINNRTHEYALYWLRAVGEIEAKLAGAGEWGIDFAKKILDDKRSTIRRSIVSHHLLERTVPCLFIIAWTAMLLSGICHLLEIGRVTMQIVLNYDSVSLAITIASLLVSAAATLIAKSSLSQAKRVADRDQKDWKQRKWYDLYFKADEAYDALDRFQALYPSTTSPGWDSPEMQREWNDLMRVMRTVHRIALVFPKNSAIQALFDATAAFKEMGEATSKERLTKISDATQGIREKSLIDASVLE